MPVLDVPSAFRMHAHGYAGYAGPWIEEVFHKYVLENGLSGRRTYLPIYWSNYIRLQEHRPNYEDALNAFLSASVDPKSKCFTVVQHCLKRSQELESGVEITTDSGYPASFHIPCDTILFSAAGIGGPNDIPIPLLKRDPAPYFERSKRRPILASFMGNIDGACDRLGVREKMNAVMQNASRRFGFQYYCGKGSIEQFYKMANCSVFCLCPRGWDPTSFRLYEVMALGAIPVYIWEGINWLPYQDELDWSEFSVVLKSDAIDTLPDILMGHSPQQIKRKQERVGELYKEWFTMDAVCRYISSKAALL